MISRSKGRRARALLFFVTCGASAFGVSSRRTNLDCDVSAGQWVNFRDSNYPRFHNSDDFQCNFRRPQSYLQYVWFASGCSIYRMQYNVPRFLSLLRHKVLLVTGDSISKNLYSVLKWSVDASSTPTQPLPANFTGVASGQTSGFVAPDYNATVVQIYSTFFVAAQGEQRVFLDQVDRGWSAFLPRTRYVVFAGFHHFFHAKVQFYVNHTLVANMSAADAVSEAMETIKGAVFAQNYSGLPMVLGFTPGHNQETYVPGGRGSCGIARRPFSDAEAAVGASSWNASAFALWDRQRAVFGEAAPFKMLDVTRLSMLRPDGHCGSGSRAKRPDCSHWCVPGVPNTWADLLLTTMMGLL